MPVLLTTDQALPLSDLLQAANTAGLAYEVISTAGPEPLIRGLGSLRHAGPHEISFLSNQRLVDQLQHCQAAAVILAPDVYQKLEQPLPYYVVSCSHPYVFYALLAQWFDQHRLANLPSGIHPSATIDETAVIESGVSIGPNTVIEAYARVGAGTRIGANCVIGRETTIGQNSLLYAQVTLYHQVSIGSRCIIHSGAIIGADGFGFAPQPNHPDGAWAKIAQLGRVLVGDDVEVGANTTIDRGALDNTEIGNGVKLDNQIMVAHNVHIGEHTAIAACVGIAGSTHIGRRCTIGGAAMLSGHLSIADDVDISGGTAITSTITGPGRYTGVYPFAEHTDWQRNAAVLSQLAGLRRRLRALERSGNT